MKIFRKGQAALEFLTTYGWAFLVILVMIGGLSYFGVLDVGKFIPDSCKLDGNLECSSFSLIATDGGDSDWTNNDGTAQIAIGVKNNLAEQIHVTGISVKEIEDTTNSFCDFTLAAELDVDSRTTEDAEPAAVTEAVDADCATVVDNHGQKKRFDLQVTYKKGNSDVVQTASGILTTTVREG